MSADLITSAAVTLKGVLMIIAGSQPAHSLSLPDLNSFRLGAPLME
ncbi:hypothetical protein B0G38_003869 [Arthrobacter sp. VKM Ac-2550]|nr:hypothetical protein [Arthrobacter sp. VKM Ac-2550]